MINNEELLFCVDENNKPIKPQPRKFVHSNDVWHRTSHIWIINSKGEVLCQKRSMLKDSAPGLWEGFFGGHLPPKVTYLNHAVIELEEEVGIKVFKKNLKKMFVYKLQRGKEFVGVFILYWNGDEKNLKLEADEVDEVRWFAKKDLIKNMNKQNGLWNTMPYEEKLFNLLYK